MKNDWHVMIAAVASRGRALYYKPICDLENSKKDNIRLHAVELCSQWYPERDMKPFASPDSIALWGFPKTKFEQSSKFGDSNISEYNLDINEVEEDWDESLENDSISVLEIDFSSGDDDEDETMSLMTEMDDDEYSELTIDLTEN